MLDPLTLDQLRILVTVAETGSFSAAARKLGRVQSAISQSIQSLETTLGIPLFDRDGKVPRLNDAGRALLGDAAQLIRGAETFRARAENIAADIEPELRLAADPVFPTEVLMASLKAFTAVFPCLPVTLFTEGLGGPEQRLRDGLAHLGLYAPLPTSGDLDSEYLVTIPTVPVVAGDHPLAAEPEPIARATIEREVQLVLTDRTPITSGLSGGIISFRQWRFADLPTRLEYLLAGFGWCYMPLPVVRQHIDSGRLKVLTLSENQGREFPIHAIYERGRPPRKAGRWLIEDLRRRLTHCTEPLALPEAPRKIA